MTKIVSVPQFLWVALAVVQLALATSQEASCQSDEGSCEEAEEPGISFLQTRSGLAGRRRGGCNWQCEACNSLITQNTYQISVTCVNTVNTCAAPFAEPAALSNMPMVVAEGTAKEFARGLSDVVPFANVLTYPLLFFFPGPNHTAQLNELYAQTQLYVTEQVGVAALSTLYETILGFQSSCVMVSQAYNLWQNASNTAEQNSSYETDFRTESLALIVSLNNAYYLFQCQTPWNGDGSNGYGIFFSQYVTIYMSVYAQFIIAYPGTTSLQQQVDMVTLAYNAIPSAVALVKDYLTLRVSYVSQAEYHGSEEVAVTGCTTAAGYSIVDNYPVYNTSGTVTAFCAWSVTSPIEVLQPAGNTWACYTCPEENTVSGVTDIINCRTSHVKTILKPLVQNWNGWMLGPARQWAQIAQIVCAMESGTGLETACVSLNTTLEGMPSNATVEAWPDEFTTDSQIACAADYGTPIGGPVCCGQEGTGTASPAAVICGELMPQCNDYVYDSHFGYCSGIGGQDTTSCPVPVGPSTSS